MKVSINLAQEFSNVDLKSIGHDELAKRVGEQLGAIEETINFAPKYKGVYVAEIVTVQDHPNADRLHICMIDDGGVVKDADRNDKGLVQVVCGAPNVREGMKVAWLPPGSVVPSSYDDSEPFELSARELRGVVSNGMLASAKELDINDDHDGILDITEDAKPGDPLVNYYGLDDFIIDCENKMFTHRPDCFGVLGVARELAGISGKEFKSPSWYLNKPHFDDASGVKLHVKSEIPKLVPRIMSVAMKNVQVGKSPIWLQALLARVGIKSINNVVDITNYIAHLTGQPMHAYDLTKLGDSLIARMGKKGETIALLNGKTIEVTEDDMVIANREKVVGLAGIMGGSETEVDFDTKDIVLECASFDMYTVRRSSMRHGLFTEASTRFTKGQSVLQNDRTLWYAIKLLNEHAGAEQSSSVYDAHKGLDEPVDVVITADFINDRLGTKLSLKDIAKLLENVEFEIKNVPADKNRLHIRSPFWRTDIEIPEDIVEEVGRLYGYDKVPVVLPMRSTKPAEQNQSILFKNELRKKLSKAGASEVLTYSFVHGKLLSATGIDPDESAYHVRNAISPDLQYYRTSLMPSLLDKVTSNLRADTVRSDDNDFAIFEIGKAHIKGDLDEDGLPKQLERLALVFAADDKTASRKYEGAPFYQAKHYLTAVLNMPVEFVPLSRKDTPLTSAYQAGRSAEIMINGQVLGVVGEFDTRTKSALKIPNFCAGFEIDLEVLRSISIVAKYQPISQFPKTQQDITFEVQESMEFKKVYSSVDEAVFSTADEQGYVITVWPRDIFKPEDSDKKRLTFRLWLSHPERTLRTEEVNKLLDDMAKKLSLELDAKRI